MERRKEGDTLTVGRQIMPLCKRWEIRREVEILISAPKVYANEVQSRNSRDIPKGKKTGKKWVSGDEQWGTIEWGEGNNK